MTRFITSLLLLALTMTGSALLAQDDSKYGDTPEQQAACKENLSLYETYYKQKNYVDAYPFWQTACEVCPPQVSQNMYIKGVNLLKRQMKPRSRPRTTSVPSPCATGFPVLRPPHRAFPLHEQEAGQRMRGARSEGHGLDEPQQAERDGGPPDVRAEHCLSGGPLARRHL